MLEFCPLHSPPPEGEGGTTKTILLVSEGPGCDADFFHDSGVFFVGIVAIIPGEGDDRFHDIHPLNDLTEDRVLAIEVRRCTVHQEEL